MKKPITAALMFTSLNSFASSGIYCQGITDPNKALLLFVNPSLKLVQIRVQTEGSLPRAFGTREIQKNRYISIYSVFGTQELIQVENSVLEGAGGTLSLSNEKFDCE